MVNLKELHSFVCNYSYIRVEYIVLSRCDIFFLVLYFFVWKQRKHFLQGGFVSYNKEATNSNLSSGPKALCTKKFALSPNNR